SSTGATSPTKWSRRAVAPCSAASRSSSPTRSTWCRDRSPMPEARPRPTGRCSCSRTTRRSGSTIRALYARRVRHADGRAQAGISTVIGVVVVRELTERDLPAAVGVVARGMRDNPLHVAALGTDPVLRGQRLTRLFTVALPMIFSKGVVLGAFDDDALAGVAGMIAPGLCQPSVTEKLAVMPRLMPAVGGGVLARVARWMNAWTEHDLPEPHWHLGPVA